MTLYWREMLPPTLKAVIEGVYWILLLLGSPVSCYDNQDDGQLESLGSTVVTQIQTYIDTERLVLGNTTCNH
jgi:hypothetical protein